MIITNKTLLWLIGSIAIVLVGTVVLCLISRKRKALSGQIEVLKARHPGISPDQWVSHAQACMQEADLYRQAAHDHAARCREIEEASAELDRRIAAFTGEQSLEQCREQWALARRTHEKLAAARLEAERAQAHREALEAIAKPAPAPQYRDVLTWSAEETLRRMEAGRLEQQQLHLELGQCQGKTDALGKESILRSRLDGILKRIARLEDTYHALDMAQNALYKASTDLQRRFAPRITKRAQELISIMTDGRYENFLMEDDLTIRTSASDEEISHNVAWRSDGTADQLYFALRMAVAEELTPDAPLVLDDALVRFDDRRLKNAMDILRKAAEHRQIILFTCHEREQYA